MQCDCKKSPKQTHQLPSHFQKIFVPCKLFYISGWILPTFPGCLWYLLKPNFPMCDLPLTSHHIPLGNECSQTLQKKFPAKQKVKLHRAKSFNLGLSSIFSWHKSPISELRWQKHQCTSLVSQLLHLAFWGNFIGETLLGALFDTFGKFFSIISDILKTPGGFVEQCRSSRHTCHF